MTSLSESKNSTIGLAFFSPISNKQIPTNTKYEEIHGLSNEVKEKLIKTQPQTIGAASQIEGVTPAAINLILIHLKKKELVSQNAL